MNLSTNTFALCERQFIDIMNYSLYKGEDGVMTQY